MTHADLAHAILNPKGSVVKEVLLKHPISWSRKADVLAAFLRALVSVEQA